MLEFKCYILIYSGNIGRGILPSLGFVTNAINTE